MAKVSSAVPDHVRIGSRLYYVTWPRLVLFCAAAIVVLLLLTSTPNLFPELDDDVDELPTGSASIASLSIPRRSVRRTKKRTQRVIKTGVMPAFCEPRAATTNSASWALAALGAPGWPAASDDASYCDWKDATSTQIPYKMCTFDRNADTQISYYIHKEGHWSGSKKEIFERVLPKVTDNMQWPERTLCIDVGANVGFYTNLFASLGYDVVSVEPAKEAVIRNLYSLQGNGINIARSGADMALGQGSNRQPIVYVYQNAAMDTYRDAYLHYVADNVGASWMTSEPPGDAIPTIALDDMLEDRHRDPISSIKPDRTRLPTIDPMRVRAIKISAEGTDSRVLNGMRRLISLGKPPFLIFVYNFDHVKGQGCNPNEMVQTLFDYGYRIYFSGTYIYRDVELRRFMKGMVSRSTELLFVGPGAEF